MADFAKKVRKHASDKLQSGEPVLGAMLVQSPGTSVWGISGAASGGVIGAVIGSVADARAEKKEAERSAGGPEEAAPFEGQNAIAAITDRRVIFFKTSMGTGKPTDIFFEMALADIERLEEEGGKGYNEKATKAKRLRFYRNDGKVFTVSAMTMALAKKNVEEFLTAFDTTGGTRV